MPQVRLTIFTPKVAQSNFAKSHKRPNLPVILKKVINKKQAAWLNPPPPSPLPPAPDRAKKNCVFQYMAARICSTVLTVIF